MFDSVIARVKASRAYMGGEVITRFALTTFEVDDVTRRSADDCVDAVLEALATGKSASVARWAHRVREELAEPMQIRELAHAACMAIAAEVAHNFRASFRDVMASLQKVEAEIARVLREPVLGPGVTAIAA